MADNRNFVNKFANQGGGDIFVEDAKLSEISTKSTIASEGVMLKGTDGAYYEIDKTSLSEVIRAELGAILADNSKNNGTSVGKVPTLNSSGNALGASSVADLASVLGDSSPLSYVKYIKAFDVVLDTGISVNAGSGGRTIIAIASAHGDAGNKTFSSICMLRCGYSGDNLAVTDVSVSRAAETYNISYSVSSSGTIVINKRELGSIRVIFISTKPF